MPNSKNLDVLNEVIASEKADNDARRGALKQLNQKMADYADELGPQPTVEEFLKWRNSVALVNFEKKLDTDFGDLLS